MTALDGCYAYTTALCSGQNPQCLLFKQSVTQVKGGWFIALDAENGTMKKHAHTKTSLEKKFKM